MLPAEREALARQVSQALAEDIGDGDLTARLLAPELTAHARIIARESAVLCGRDWVDAVFEQLDADLAITWHCADGARTEPGKVLFEAHGNARALLSGERTALNFLQTLSGTASLAADYVAAVAGTKATILDTRKTLPGLRLAQKYAVRCGGASNHRIGLYDAILIKENHIRAAGSIAAALEAAQRVAAGRDLMIEIEVEDLDELAQALQAGCKRILLDNFDEADLSEAVAVTRGRAALEASGGVNLATIGTIARTGVDFISVGQLTKDVRAIDFSMLFG